MNNQFYQNSNNIPNNQFNYNQSVNNNSFVQKKKFNPLFIIIPIIILIAVIFLISPSEKTMVCTRKLTKDGIEFNLRYEVTYKNKNVKKVKSIEKIKSDDKDTLESFEKTLKNTYSNYDKIDYYDNEISIDDDTLTSIVNIDYEKIDTDKLIELDSSNAKIIKDGKININDMKLLYESIGAICEK